MGSRSEVLRLYRLLLRESNKFTSYNFRSYAIRKARDTFREHKDETDPEKVKFFLKRAEKELQSLKRQTLIDKIYGTSRLVIES